MEAKETKKPSGAPAFVEFDPYTGHNLGRQMGASAFNATLSLARAVGDYQINASLLLLNPADPRFQGSVQKLYDPQSRWGKSLRKIFMPNDPQNVEQVHRSAMRFRNVAAWGSFAPILIRLGANAYHPEYNEELPPLERGAIWTDSASLVTRTASLGLFNAGQQMATHCPPKPVGKLLKLGWHTNILGSVFQIGSGLAHIQIESAAYFEGRPIHNSTLLYSAVDVFSGTSAIAWSQLVLSEAKKEAQTSSNSSKVINGVTAENHALLGVVEPARRIKWGLRMANGLGAAVGVGLNSYDLIDSLCDDSLAATARRSRAISAGIGLAGSVLMGAACLLVGTSMAPIAGLCLAGGFVALTAQTIFDYFST